MSDFLSGLPVVSFCETDASAVEARIIADYETVAGVTLYPGDPVRLFLEGVAYVIAQQNLLIDDTAKKNLLAYSTGGYLDNLGALVDTRRLGLTPARVTMRFELGGPLEFPVAVPAGIRVTADALTFWTVEAGFVIPPGETHGEASCVCQTPGSSGNGLLPGQINRLVDPLPYVVRVANTAMSLGGSDDEDDARFRERVRLSPERFSTAGPAGAWLYWAMSAHQDIADVAVITPAPGEVDIRPLMRGGQIPSLELIGLVRRAVEAQPMRPLTDRWQVQPPEAVLYAVAVSFTVARSDSALAAGIEQAVRRAVDQYVSWQRAKLGRDVNPLKLASLMEQAGAKLVDVASPAFTRLEPRQVAQESSVSVVFAGVEDD